MYVCVNYRPQNGERECGYYEGRPIPGKIVADLYDEEGFYRTAVVAESFTPGKFCDEHNNG